MALKFTPQFTEKDIRNFIRKKIKVLDDILLDRFKQVGEQFVADARSVDTYKDRTGNLRSSIGYLIMKDGEEIFGNFHGDNLIGESQGKTFAKKIAGEHPRGYLLVVVAGMFYAAAVESKGYDVITGSSQVATDVMRKSIDRVRKSLQQLK